jgi:hypothetical protein
MAAFAAPVPAPEKALGYGASSALISSNKFNYYYGMLVWMLQRRHLLCLAQGWLGWSQRNLQPPALIWGVVSFSIKRTEKWF